MSRRDSRSIPPKPQPKQFSSIAEIENGITKLKRRLQELEALDPTKITHDVPQVKTVTSNIRETILEIFGADSPEYHEHQYHEIWYGGGYAGMSRDQCQRCFAEGLEHSKGMVQGLLTRLEEKKLDFAVPSAPGAVTSPKKKRVFIGHGSSDEWLTLKSLLVDRLHLEYEEFNRLPAAGLSTKERLGQMLESSCFAFLVMTAEDEHADGSRHARENVVHEAGLFQGRYGFERAIVLLEEGCAEFSNIHGITQIRFPKGNIMASSEKIRRVLEREELISA